jgi:sodium-dependent dicarboxylate transporter 2/3/5
MSTKQKIIIPVLILVTIIFFIFQPPVGMSIKAWRTSNLTIILAVLWMTETIPITITALLPIVLIPLFQIDGIKQATAPYANELVFLFMGGFFIAAAIEKVNLHRRFAIMIIEKIGYSKKKIILSFMFVTTFLSMWISNTATVLIMLPMALSILKETSSENENRYEVALLLAIAYSASIGGIATLIGTPPNAFTAAFVKENYNIEISFMKWMTIGLTFSITSFIALYFILKFLFLNNLDKGTLSEHKKPGMFNLNPISKDEVKVFVVFLLVTLCWITQPFLSKIYEGINDTVIAITGAIALFIIPSEKSNVKILEWNDAHKISWGILILFGGGLSLASVIQSSGLAEWLGNLFVPLKFIPPYFIVFLISFTIILLTELTSNLATTATFIPIVASIATGMNANILLFVIPATIAASCAFMLPVGTPPNAIIFSSNRIKISDMIKTGIYMIVASIIIIMTIIYLILPIFVS